MSGWEERGEAMARQITWTRSPWWRAVCTVPRHLLVPRWWDRSGEHGSWTVQDGPSDQAAWLEAAYDGNRTMVTQAGAVHADHADPGTTSDDWPGSSSTMPKLVIDMYRHARLFDEADILDIGTGSGYGTALLTCRLGDQHVTSIDVDPYLTAAATERLDSLSLHPLILTADAAAALPGSYDRIVPMVSLPAIPASWLTALRPEGRLVFSLTGGSVLITAGKTPDGGAAGRVELYPAAFMAARHDRSPSLRQVIPDHALHGDGEQITTGPYPVVDPAWGWELDAILSVTTPGLAIRSRTGPQPGVITTLLAHPDGSWARAAGRDNEPAEVHQAGPRRLWDDLDDLRRYWLTRGCLPLRGARARVDPDGTCHLSQGQWHAVIPAANHEK